MVSGRLRFEFVGGVLVIEVFRPDNPGRMIVTFPPKAPISKAEVRQITTSLVEAGKEGFQVPHLQKTISIGSHCFEVDAEQLRELSQDEVEMLAYHVQEHLLNNWPEKADKTDVAYDFPE